MLDQIDHKDCISHRLYRDHTVFEFSNFIKDLKLLGRDLKKTIILDNNHMNFKY